jgi:hypothetical protein
MTSEAQRLREQAERCLRLAKGTSSDGMRQRLRDVAAEYLEEAEALERTTDQHQQVGNVVPAPEPSHGAAQQQQQVQPKKADDPE